MPRTSNLESIIDHDKSKRNKDPCVVQGIRRSGLSLCQKSQSDSNAINNDPYYGASEQPLRRGLKLNHSSTA